MDLTFAAAVLTLLLSSWAAMSCASCCGSCTEPTCPGTCSVNCGSTGLAGYSFVTWPSISGAGCLPGGNCQFFANRKFCLKNVSPDLWQTDRFSVDCSTTYGVTVDIQWQLTIDGSGNALLALYAFLTGTSTLVATIVEYSGTVTLGACDQQFTLTLSFDGGQCTNWPRNLVVIPNCCSPPVVPGQCFCNDGIQAKVVNNLGELFATLSSACPDLDGLVLPLEMLTDENGNIACIVGGFAVVPGGGWTLYKTDGTVDTFATSEVVGTGVSIAISVLTGGLDLEVGPTASSDSASMGSWFYFTTDSTPTTSSPTEVFPTDGTAPCTYLAAPSGVMQYTGSIGVPLSRCDPFWGGPCAGPPGGIDYATFGDCPTPFALTIDVSP